MDPGWGQQDVGWAALLILFAASLLTVFGWLLQYARGLWLARARGGRGPGPALAAEPAGSLRELGVWRSLLRLRPTRAGAPEEPGVRGLLASLFAFKSFRENWQRAWVRALNEQACRDGVSWTGAPRWFPQPFLPGWGGRDCSCLEGQMGVGINWRTLRLLFPSGITEKGAGEAGGCRNLAMSQILYSVVKVLSGCKPKHKLLFS